MTEKGVEGIYRGEMEEATICSGDLNLHLRVEKSPWKYMMWIHLDYELSLFRWIYSVSFPEFLSLPSVVLFSMSRDYAKVLSARASDYDDEDVEPE